jgi:hypothetical protein
MIGGYLVQVTIAREQEAPARLLYLVAEDDEEHAVDRVRRLSRAAPSATVEALGPVTKTEVRRRRLKPGDAVPVFVPRNRL